MNLKKTGLVINNMSFAFADHTPFFSGISCQFSRGAINGIMGKNGSGKSTLFRILQGRTEPDELMSGKLTIDEVSINLAESSAQRQCSTLIKAVVQNINEMVVTTCTVQQNLQLANISEYPGLQRLPDADDVSNILKKVGIRPDAYVSQLSGGQRQILAILMMLQQSAQVLLLDEPTSALDAQNAFMVMDCVQELAQSKDLVVVIISHDHELVNTCVTGSLFEIQQHDTGERVLQLTKMKARAA